MNKINNTRLSHNVGTHKEKMEKRRIVQRNRTRNISYPKGSKYVPLVEDQKNGI